eukprot:11220778-Lingulodinium_polyedra.AAC.1
MRRRAPLGPAERGRVSSPPKRFSAPLSQASGISNRHRFAAAGGKAFSSEHQREFSVGTP